MAWIEVVETSEASGQLGELYERQTVALGGPTELTMAGSLYPELSLARASLYEVVESCPSSFTPKERQAIAVALAASLRSEYLSSGVEHKFLAVGGTAQETARLRAGDFTGFSPKLQAAGAYALKVAVAPTSVQSGDVELCRAAGASDLDILDANSLASYYSYLASICLGLGLLERIAFS